jgi:hypothetical protein
MEHCAEESMYGMEISEVKENAKAEKVIHCLGTQWD